MKRKLYAIIGAVCLICAVLCLGVFIGGRMRTANIEENTVPEEIVNNPAPDDSGSSEEGYTARDDSNAGNQDKPDSSIVDLPAENGETESDKEEETDISDETSEEETQESSENEADEETKTEIDKTESDKDVSSGTTVPSQSGTTQNQSSTSTQGSTNQGTTQQTQTVYEYKSAHPNGINFDALTQVNPDIYAWIEIPGTKVDYPILQRQDDADGSYYLSHAYDGSEYICGSIFTEAAYNSKTFDDKCTVVYGHTTLNGTMFGSLQYSYTDSWGFKAYKNIYIFTPDKTLHYKVIGCGPFSTRHILYTFDFDDSLYYRAFIYAVTNDKTINTQFDDSVEIDYNNDKLLVLSTCLNGTNGTQRFLVMAILQDS